MARQIINTGTIANDGTGDTLRISFSKTNNNFAELYSSVSNVTTNLDITISTNEIFHGQINLRTGLAFDTANAAFAVANNLDLLAQTAANLAQSASKTANAAGIIANSAYDLSNTLTIKVNTAYSIANAAYDQSNLVYTFANTRASIVNATAAFLIANLSFDKTNNAYLTANAGLEYALSAFGTANAAFGRGNVAHSAANQAGVIANAVFDVTNSAYNITNVAFGRVNTTWSRANSIYNFANSVLLYATYGFIHANSAFDKANGAFTVTNSAYVVVNSAYTSVNAGYLVANAGFAKANAALPNTDGSVFNGRLFTSNTLFGGSLTNYANGVYGTSYNWYGVYARSATNHAIKAESVAKNDAVFTLAQAGNGVFGTANTGNGVVGFSESGYGGYFYSSNGVPFGSGYLRKADDDTLQVVDAMIVDANGMVKFDSGYGFPSPVYGCRAWVNFDGTSQTSSLTNLQFVANATTNLIRVYVNDPANNDIEVDSTVYLIGTGNGTRRRHTDGSSLVFACWLAVGCRRETLSRTYKVKTVNQTQGWFECDYPDQFGYIGYWRWFYWWWWWYFIYGWFVPRGFSYTGTCNIMRSQIRGAGGITSVEDLGDGRYQLNFDFEMPDTNYAVTGTASSPEFSRIQYVVFPFRTIGWASGTSLTVRTLHTTFCEVACSWHWGGPTYWWWYWWWGYFWYYWNGPGTYPAKHVHVAIFR